MFGTMGPMSDDPRKDLQSAINRLMKAVASAGEASLRADKAREQGLSDLGVYKAHRDAEKAAHEQVDSAISAYKRAAADGTITLGFAEEPDPT